MRSVIRCLVTVLLASGVFGVNPAFGQLGFSTTDIQKIPYEDYEKFEEQFGDVDWTSSGFDASLPIDRIPTSELRARLQKVYGDPTFGVEDLMNQPDFSPSKYIQFEYWFIVDDEIPMIVLDVDGPFRSGLIYAGAPQFVDLMPEIKRNFSSELMSVDSLAEYRDYFYVIDEDQWYVVGYEDGEFLREEISQPSETRSGSN